MENTSLSDALISLIPTYGPWTIFGIVALESAGVPLPGETILVAAARPRLRRRSSRAEPKDVGRFFVEAGKRRLGIKEDPAEDVLVALIVTRRGDFRVIEGIWEAAAATIGRPRSPGNGGPSRGNNPLSLSFSRDHGFLFDRRLFDQK
jgi:hypothetical protein